LPTFALTAETERDSASRSKFANTEGVEKFYALWHAHVLRVTEPRSGQSC